LLLRPSTWLHSPISTSGELLGSLSSAFLISFSLSTKRSNSSRESENSNQLGYTTPAIQGRTSFYATDLAKSISAPVLHVNGDRIDDVARCLRLALAYQRKFRKDVIVDLVVYRRLGHNELDEPSFTSPIMYRRIKDLPSVASIYEKSLIETGTLDSSDVASFKKEHFAKLDTSLVAAEPKNFQVPELEMPRGWNEMTWPERGDWEKSVETGVGEQTLKEVGKRSVQTPDDIVSRAVSDYSGNELTDVFRIFTDCAPSVDKDAHR